ncbi:MAG TPA: PhoU domain-containing protein [Lysobacter sp.]
MVTTATPASSHKVPTLLAGALRRSAGQLAEAGLRWKHNRDRPPFTESASADLADVDLMAVDALRQPTAPPGWVLAAVRISEDVRQIDQLIANLRAIPPPRSTAHCEHLARLADLTGAEVEAAIDCLMRADSPRVQWTLDEEATLDRWYDQAVIELVEELADDDGDTPEALPVLAAIRSMERISGHAQHVVATSSAWTGNRTPHA